MRSAMNLPQNENSSKIAQPAYEMGNTAHVRNYVFSKKMWLEKAPFMTNSALQFSNQAIVTFKMVRIPCPLFYYFIDKCSKTPILLHTNNSIVTSKLAPLLFRSPEGTCIHS